MQQISLGEAMKQRRLELGLPQEIVCEGICEAATLSRLENGKQTMAYNRVKALMQRLNMPDDRFYALLSKQETELDNARKELSACVNRFECAQGEQKRRMRKLALEQLHRLESLAEKDDSITQQDILNYKVMFGHEQGTYSQEECLKMLLFALRLTVPNFNLDKLGVRRYSMQETRILNQIAETYSRSGDHPQALRLYQQLFAYVSKHDDCLSTYAQHFTLIAHNYARELGLSKYYHESVEIAEQGRRVSVKYGYYQFLPGFLYIAGESYYHLGEERKSKKLMVRAHYLYEELEDEYNLQLIDRDIKNWFNLDLDL